MWSQRIFLLSPPASVGVSYKGLQYFPKKDRIIKSEVSLENPPITP